MSVLAARRGVQDLLQAFVDHVAVALEREHERVGKHALHAGRDRRRPAVQRLHEVDVHRARERRVATDARDRDRVLDLRRVSSIVSRNCRTASGSPQPGHMWCSSVSSRSGLFASMRRAIERRRGRVEHRPVRRSRSASLLLVRLQRVACTLVAGDRRHRLVSVQARGCVREMASTSSSRPTPKPEWSVDTPPMNVTGACPADADAHVVDHLARATARTSRRGGADAVASRHGVVGERPQA